MKTSDIKLMVERLEHLKEEAYNPDNDIYLSQINHESSLIQQVIDIAVEKHYKHLTVGTIQ